MEIEIMENEEYSNSYLVQAQSLLDSSINNHEGQMQAVAFWRSEIAASSVYYGAGTEKAGDSGMTPKDIKKAIESAIPSLVEPFLNKNIVNAKGKDAESDQKSEVVESRLNYVWNYGMRTLPLMERIARDMMTDGTVFIKTNYNSEGKMPGVEVMNIDAIITDPSAESLEDCKFVIERKKVSVSEIIDNPGWYGQHSFDDLSALGASSTTEYDMETVGAESYFNFEERAQQLIDISIYYGEVVDNTGSIVNKVIIWADDFLINEMDSPYPNGWAHPFDSEVYTRVSGSLYGESIAELLSVNQRIRTGLNRAILDSLSRGTNGQRAVKKGALDIVNKGRFSRGENFEYQTQGGLDIWEGQFAQTPPSVYELLDRIQADSEELSGISRMNAGLDPRALNSGVSATASALVNSAAERRLLLITRHISALLESLFRKWIDLDVMMLEDDTVAVRVEGNLLDITGLDMEGNYDLTLDVATIGQKQEKGQQLSMVLQQLAQNPAIPQSITMRLTSELVETMDMYQLSEELKVLSKQMEQQEQQPQQPQQPSPEEQIAIQLEIQAQQAATAKDQSVAQLNEAKAMETFVNTEKATYE